MLFMTLPGLSAFYGGLVKRKNQLSVFMQCLATTCVSSVMWFLFGYSLCFAPTSTTLPVVGNLDKVAESGRRPRAAACANSWRRGMGDAFRENANCGDPVR